MKKLDESTSTGPRLGAVRNGSEAAQLASGGPGSAAGYGDHDVGTGAGGREAAASRVGLTLGGAVLAIVAGFVAIGLAWYHSGNTNQLWIQNQELISGGVGGLALVLVGVGLLICDQLQRIGSLLGRRQIPPQQPAVHPLEPAELANPDTPATNNRRRLLTADRSR